MKYTYLILILLSQLTYAKTPLTSSRLDKLSGEAKANFDHKSIWDKRYSKRQYVYGKVPAKFLAENFDYLRPESKVLDIGMGEGRNSVFLAQKGHQVTGIDISSVAIKKAKLLAKELGVRIQTILGTATKYKIQPESYDAIICFYFVDRSLNKKMMSWLKPGGILIYAAHTTNQYNQKGSKRDNIEFYLQPQELLTMFPGMTILKFEEPQHEQFYRTGIILKKRTK